MIDNLSEFASSPDQNTLDQIFWAEIVRDRHISHELYCAVENGRIESVKSLISQGANVNMKGLQGNSLVHMAAIKGYLDVLKILVENFANFEVVDAYGCKPICTAAAYHQSDVIKYLVQIGADLGSHSYILMNVAVRNNDAVLVSLLVDRGVGINIADASGRTALHYAAENEKLDVMNCLIAKGADMDIKANDGCTPLAHAILHQKYQSVVLLCSLGADVRDSLNFFQNSVDEIFVHRSLAVNLSAALKVYNAFSKHKGDFKDNLLNIILGLLENFEREWNYEKINTWLQDKSLGDLTDVINETHNLMQSCSCVKEKFRKSKNESINKIYSQLKNTHLKTLINLLETDLFKLAKNSILLDNVTEKVPSLLRLKDISIYKKANFSTEELLNISNLNISDLKLGYTTKSSTPSEIDMPIYDEDDLEMMQIFDSVKMDSLEEGVIDEIGKEPDDFSDFFDAIK